jgi:predicted dehydrogenase
MMRVGLVGAGFIGGIHAYALALLRRAGVVDAELGAVYDLDARRAAAVAERHGGQAVGSLDELLDRVDAVWCCPWTGAHLAVVTAAAGAGRSVFCEKPLGRDLAEAAAVAEQLRRVPHRVGLVLRASPVLDRLAAEVSSGAHGPVLAVVFRDDQYFPDHGIYRSDWRADPARAGSGTLLEHSIHDVDLVVRLLGMPAWVAARTAARTGRPVEDVAAVLLGYDDGTAVSLTSVWHGVTSRESTRHLEVHCEHAVLTVDHDTVGPIRVDGPDGRRTIGCAPPEWTAALDVAPELLPAMTGYVVQARAVLEAFAGVPGARGPGAEEALAAHAVVDAAYRAAASGAPVALAGAASPPAGRAL